MKYTQSFRPSARRSLQRGFTLVEILVVLAVIAILAGILLPVLNGAKERANQASCATNMQQLYMAVKLYYDDEKRYPMSLAVLLPPNASLNNDPTTTGKATTINNVADSCDTGSGTCLNVRGTGYLKGTGNLVCPSADPPQDGKPWSSYGDVSTGFPTLPATYDPANDPMGNNMSRYVWNYWGYTDNGTGYVGINMSSDTTGAPVSAQETEYRTRFAGKMAFQKPSTPVTPVDVKNVDEYKLPRLGNRYAPPSTVITHCVYHRIPTANRLGSPADLYKVAANDTGAKDIVLRLDGSARTLDVVSFKGASADQSSWVLQNYQ
jgi:prepilin-type N-terminal cleavage/methylation domain-containing protein